ncbi:MAG TPA: M24 family metallopeptidase [Acidimicrobiales bacterium]|jgi:Xaa-Pro aminopeptidase|nr:M24 family metallopeptidase [Acidimicrobiales bacterium]
MATEVLADEAALRQARRQRALAQMEAHGIDALLLGREANARYLAGAQRLWTAGTRPYGPGCVVIRETAAIHLVSTWDEGIPDEIPHQNLFGITWNPGNLFAWLGQIEGLAGAARIGTDSLTPRFAQILPKLFPNAEFVDAEPALEAARRVKTPEEIGVIRLAIEVAERAAEETRSRLQPGVTERQLAGVFMASMAGQGVTTPATQRVAAITTAADREDRADRTVRATDLVTIDGAVVAAGYTGEVARTWPASDQAVTPAVADQYARAEQLWARLLKASTAGASCADYIAAYRAEGVDLPQRPIVTGLGLGFDRPVVTADLAHTAGQEHLVPGMVLAVTAHVGTVIRKDSVLITTDGPELLTTSPYWKQEQ